MCVYFILLYSVNNFKQSSFVYACEVKNNKSLGFLQYNGCVLCDRGFDYHSPYINQQMHLKK